VAQDWFGVGDWEHLSPTAGWIASVLVVGTLQQLCAYVAVRYTVYLTDEFDEPADGLVYASAAGLGIATAANVAFVLRNDGVVPLSGAAHIATNCLIHLAAAAALGYGLGRNRFLGHPRQLWLGGAFLLSVLINGGLKQLAVRAGIDGGTFRPWVSLTVAVVVVAIILVAIDALMARLSFENFAKPVGARPAEGSRKEAASP
jgi:RsiW-degrading membrane proteinase PrsW (M82 family)